jgi:hypothetical protein
LKPAEEAVAPSTLASGAYPRAMAGYGHRISTAAKGGKKRTHDDARSDGRYSGYGSEGEHGDSCMRNAKEGRCEWVIALYPFALHVSADPNNHGLLLVAYVTTGHAREGSEQVGLELVACWYGMLIAYDVIQVDCWRSSRSCNQESGEGAKNQGFTVHAQAQRSEIGLFCAHQLGSILDNIYGRRGRHSPRDRQTRAMSRHKPDLQQTAVPNTRLCRFRTTIAPISRTRTRYAGLDAHQIGL